MLLHCIIQFKASMKCFYGFWLNTDLITHDQLAKNVMSDSSGFNLLLQSKNESSLMHMPELLVSLPRGKGKIQHSHNI